MVKPKITAFDICIVLVSAIVIALVITLPFIFGGPKLFNISSVNIVSDGQEINEINKSIGGLFTVNLPVLSFIKTQSLLLIKLRR